MIPPPTGREGDGCVRIVRTGLMGHDGGVVDRSRCRHDAGLTVTDDGWRRSTLRCGDRLDAKQASRVHDVSNLGI